MAFILKWIRSNDISSYTHIIDLTARLLSDLFFSANWQKHICEEFDIIQTVILTYAFHKQIIHFNCLWLGVLLSILLN